MQNPNLIIKKLENALLQKDKSRKKYRKIIAIMFLVLEDKLTFEECSKKLGIPKSSSKRFYAIGKRMAMNYVSRKDKGLEI